MAQSAGGVHRKQQIIPDKPGELTTTEICNLIARHEDYETELPPPSKPKPGSVILYNKEVVKNYKQDGYNWTTPTHSTPVEKRVKVLEGYFYKEETNENLRRRIYWRKYDKKEKQWSQRVCEPPGESRDDKKWDIALVHYLQIPQRRTNTNTRTTGSHQANGFGTLAHPPLQPSPDHLLVVPLGISEQVNTVVTSVQDVLPQSELTGHSSGIYNQADAGSFNPTNLFFNGLGDNDAQVVDLTSVYPIPIHVIAPNWAYEYTSVEVVICGEFPRGNQQGEGYQWNCVFGRDPVPAEFLPNAGVLRCFTPKRKAGKVPLYVIDSTRSMYSEMREFEFKAKLIPEIDSSSGRNEVSQICHTPADVAYSYHGNQSHASHISESANMFDSFSRNLRTRKADCEEMPEIVQAEGQGSNEIEADTQEDSEGQSHDTDAIQEFEPILHSTEQPSKTLRISRASICCYKNARLSQYITSPSGFSYDVFLSFRGEDTRKNFTDHLYTALVNAGMHTFRDELELERGENIKQGLETAIQQSRISVIVFSKYYSSSRWCLDELVKILERKRTSNHVVLPVFYEVRPSQVRKQAESLAKVPKYEQNQSLNRWRAALREVADLAGMVLEDEVDGHEAKFIQKIVKEIEKKLGRVPLNYVQAVLEEKLRYANQVLDVDEGKQLNNPSVRDWLSELKEAVNDADNLLQEIKTKALRQKMEPESGSSTSEVQELNSGSPSHAFQSAFVYRRVKELDRLDSIMERRRDVLTMEETAGCRVLQTIQSTSLVDHSSVCGRDAEKESLIKLLLSDDESCNKRCVIAIVGMGGMGKTTLAQLVYNDVRVKQHFHVRAWACVSGKFDVLQISQHIYESIASEACQISNLAVLQSKLQKELMGKRFLIVLDDFWNENYDQLESLRRPFEYGAQGSKIIVTTRHEVVSRMTHSVVAHRLMPMCENDGWSLFKIHAFRNAVSGAHSHLEGIGRQVVQKCKGLPSAIKSLGGLLSKLSVEKWESMLNSDCTVEISLDDNGILPISEDSKKWLNQVPGPPEYLE